MNYPSFKVIVRCFTYNQSKYIVDAMNGFTMQQTDFPYVCCIADDASTDGEQKVLHEYMEANFAISDETVAYQKETEYAHITYAPHKTNKNCYFAVLYLKENHYSNPQKYRGKKREYLKEWTDNVPYEAICEGDDYWIDPLKLQKQVDFLETNPDYGLCYSRCNYFNQEKQKFERYGWGGPYVLFEDLVRECTVPTHTVMIRGNVLRQYLAEGHTENRGWLMGDYPMWLWFAHESKIHFMEDITSVYRVLNNSASHSDRLEGYEKFMYSTYDMLSYFCALYNCQSLISSDRLYSALFSAAVMYGDIKKEKEYFKKIKKTNITQKMKHIVCCNKLVYKIFASCLFYTK